MMDSTWRTMLRITTWGESHGKSIGVVIGRYLAGLEPSEVDIQVYLDRKESEQNRYAAMRQGGDQAEILSGMLEGRAMGTPISLLIRNQDQRSHDYNGIMDVYRPGYVDYTFDREYGFQGYRGGRRSSGREAIGRVVVGAVAAKLLDSLGVQVMTYTRSIGDIEVAAGRFDVMETGWS